MRNLFLPVVCLGLIAGAWGQGHTCEDDYQDDGSRVGCPGSDHDTVEDSCRLLNCTWCPTVPDTPIPWCYVSSVSSGYMMVGTPVETPDGVTVQLQKNAGKARWEGEVETLTLKAEFQSNERLRIKITPSTGPARWEVPLEVLPLPGGNANPLYSVEFTNSPNFNFKIIRKSTGTVLFDTSVGQKNFVYANQYLSVTWQVPSENVYGIGENEQHTFKHNFAENNKYPLWARDKTPEGTINLYGVQPYYTVLEEDGNAHSVALVNSNAQEFTFKGNSTITYITIGGIMDMMVFLGPTPENVVQQYTSSVGRAPMPPYWALGFQLCRFGYNNIANMKAAVERTRQYDIPHDVQYGDIDIMERMMDFTYDKVAFAGLPEYVRELKAEGIKFVTILDPCVSIEEPAGTYPPYDEGQRLDVWIHRADGTPVQGKVWPNNLQAICTFPDFFNNVTRQWWIDQIVDFHSVIEFDGLWIDMNEPANFVDGDVEGCTGGELNSPEYVPPVFGGRLWGFTLCMDSVQAAGNHYNVHNLYGWSQSEPTFTGTIQSTGKRSLVLSRSTFLGSGKWAAHWLGDNFSRWNNLHYSIIGMLQFNHFGIPMAGSDICGFNENTDEEQCQRWQQLGSFYPFSRNHNAIGQTDQDPGFFGPALANSTRTALRIRYTLLPYLYTLFHHHHTRGDTVVRALWHEYPTDMQTTTIDKQFLWGSGLLISPVLDAGATTVSAYFPDGRFYSYYDGAEVATRRASATLAAPLDFIPLHVHGGNILPTQEPARNTEISRNLPFGLIVALDDDDKASGSLFYDDGGDTIDPHAQGNYFFAEYSFDNMTLSGTVVTNGYTGMASKTLDTIRVMGISTFRSIEVNGNLWLDWTNGPEGAVDILHLQLDITKPLNAVFIV